MADDIQKSKLHWFETLMLFLITSFTGGTFTLVWKDHEKMWDHEVRITVMEKQGRSGQATAYVYSEATIPKKLKPETLR